MYHSMPHYPLYLLFNQLMFNSVIFLHTLLISQQTIANIMKKFGVTPSLPAIQGFAPVSLQGGLSSVNNPFNQNPLGNIMQVTKEVQENTFQGMPGHENVVSSSGIASESAALNSPYGSRTEKVVSNFLQNPLLKDEVSEANALVSK